jgi:hypothetical protein
MLKITPVGDKAELGSWANYRGVKLKIARLNNTAYRNKLRSLMRPYQKEIDNNTLDDDLSDQLICEALTGTILLDWEKETFPGKVEYTKDNAIDLLINDIDCRNFVLEFAGDIGNYLERDEVATKKES